MTEPPRNPPDLFKVMTFATAVSFGVLGAVMVSMHGFFGGDISFEFSFKTIVGFIAGCAAGWVLWWIVRRIMGKSH